MAPRKLIEFFQLSEYNNMTELQSGVNYFIEDKDDVDIKISESYGVERYVTIMVVYSNGKYSEKEFNLEKDY